MRKFALALLPLVFGQPACASQPKDMVTSDHTCNASTADAAWLNDAALAWRLVTSELAQSAQWPHTQAIFFDKACVLESPGAFDGAQMSASAFVGKPHGGKVKLPGGDEIPATVTSFALHEEDQAYIVMALPSIWQEAKVRGGDIGILRLVTAVLLHEASHGVQIPTYGEQMTALSKKYNLPDDFGDDSIQDAFEEEPAFVASVKREMRLLFEAARQQDLGRVIALAAQALNLLAQRRARFFVGDNDYMNQAEDIWLTLEGSGQWLGYQWLLHPKGGGVDEPTAMKDFGTRSRFWTQNEGLALFLVADRLGLDWLPVVFGDGGPSIAELLQEALSPEILPR